MLLSPAHASSLIYGSHVHCKTGAAEGESFMAASTSGQWLLNGHSTDVHGLDFQIFLADDATCSRQLQWGDEILLHSSRSGKYCTVEEDGSLKADRAKAITWERFRIFPYSESPSGEQNPPVMLKSWLGTDIGPLFFFLAPEVHKSNEQYRDYKASARQEVVERTYRLMHTNQTYEFVQGQKAKYAQLGRKHMSVMDAITALDALVDDSDPDTDVPNSWHDFQTAERIRAAWPEHDWFHLVGLVHDLGKMLCILYDEPQWAVVGDTFPVGCRFDEACVFHDSFKLNPDSRHPVYSTTNGVYEPGCGLDALSISWGHDEYMYQVLKQHPQCTIPEEGLRMIRYHSLYPWHTGNAYKQFEDESDRKALPWVLEFNKFDLYSKSDAVPNIEELRPYYEGLVAKYCPGLLAW